MFPLLIKAVKVEGLKPPEEAILIQIADLTNQLKGRGFNLNDTKKRFFGLFIATEIPADTLCLIIKRKLQANSSGKLMRPKIYSKRGSVYIIQ
jgi:hypothetical protein